VSQIPNPYASPTFAVEPTVSNMTVPNASQNRRFLNLIIDNVVLQVFSYAAGMALGTFFVVANGGRFGPDDKATLQVMGFFLGLVIAYLYFFLLEAVCQKTIGKMLTGTKVVTMDGGRPSVGQFLGRAAARFIPFEAFSFLTKEPRGWHDSLTGTRVIRG
jgi:uncharacterized RDD family membrane protein YckC